MDTTLKTKIISRLKGEFHDLSPGLKAVAKYIIDNPGDFGLDPIRETARKSGVSTYSLVRMAKYLGLDGFEELRAPFRAALVSGTELSGDLAWVDELAAQGGTGAAQAQATLNTLSIVQRSLHQLDPARAQRVVDMMTDARKVYLTGVRAAYGPAYYFHYVGHMALTSLELIPRHVNSAIDDLTDASDRDVLIVLTFAPYSKETIQACLFAQSKGVKLIMISDSEVIAPDLRPAEVLVVSTVTTHFFGCYVGVMAVIENLLALLVERGGRDAQQRIDAYDMARREAEAYWRRPKKR